MKRKNKCKKHFSQIIAPTPYRFFITGASHSHNLLSVFLSIFLLNFLSRFISVLKSIPGAIFSRKILAKFSARFITQSTTSAVLIISAHTQIIMPAQANEQKETLEEKPAHHLFLFSQKDHKDWQEKSFSGHTLYSFDHVSREYSGDTVNSNNEALNDSTLNNIALNHSSPNNNVVLSATSQNSASGLIKHIRIDLKQTPWLHWRWKIKTTIQASSKHPIDETQKAGDDYAARVYVIIDGGLLFWKTLALNYVWASHQAQGSTWPNAYAGKNAMMLALRSGEEKTGLWVSEQRNVYEDLKAIFGRDIQYIDAIAIMTDTDNTGTRAHAAYQGLYFSDL